MLTHQKSVLWFFEILETNSLTFGKPWLYIYIEELPWNPPSIWCGYFLLENQLPFKKTFCNLGPSDSLHNLDLTSEKKKIIREFFTKFWSEKYDFDWYRRTNWYSCAEWLWIIHRILIISSASISSDEYSRTGAIPPPAAATASASQQQRWRLQLHQGCEGSKGSQPHGLQHCELHMEQRVRGGAI